MKKSFYSFLFLFAALLSVQNVNAQQAEAIYTADFTQGSNGWSAEGDYVDQGAWDASEGALVAYAHMATGACSSKMISPFIKLADKDNTVSFRYQGFYFGDITKEAELLIREEGGEWANITMNYPPKDDYSVFNTGDMAVSADYNGKNVQFAFKYNVLSTEFIGYWCIQDFNVKGVKTSSVEKADPQIAFDATEATFTLGDAEFKAPVLSNPNNLKVYYSSDNEAVATVSEDGTVTIVGMGTAVISAKTLENDQFKKGEASYILKVVDPEIVFAASFYLDNCGFTSEFTGAEYDAWMYEPGTASMMADGYELVSKMTTFYLVSPEMTLDAVGNEVSFEHIANLFTDIQEQAQLVIREVGGEWVVLDGIQYENVNSEDWTTSGNIAVPAAFNGKNVQIAFKYSTDGMDNCGSWFVRNLIVKRVKADPMISFSVDKMEYYIDGDVAFVQPELNNPNNVEVVYSSDNELIAYTDETGYVYFVGTGEVTITATSVETEQFKSAKASYTITISTVPTSIESVSAEDLRNGKIYDLQGRRVNTLSKGIYVVNGKKVVVK